MHVCMCVFMFVFVASSRRRGRHNLRQERQ